MKIPNSEFRIPNSVYDGFGPKDDAPPFLLR